MGIVAKRTSFTIPAEILDDLKKYVGRGQQSRFVAEALRKALKILRLEIALEESFGAWKDNDHPELKEGTDNFIRKLRKSSP